MIFSCKSDDLQGNEHAACQFVMRLKQKAAAALPWLRSAFHRFHSGHLDLAAHGAGKGYCAICWSV
jgi:hypothetical protein